MTQPISNQETSNQECINDIQEFVNDIIVSFKTQFSIKFRIKFVTKFVTKFAIKFDQTESRIFR